MKHNNLKQKMVMLGVAVLTMVMIIPVAVQAKTVEGTLRPYRPAGLHNNDGPSAAEISGLMFLREEEKVARDVYLAMSDLYNARVFSNISNSEQTHMNAILGLLEKYGLDDPVGSNPEGVFSNQDLQNLYDNLVEIGESSLIDALRVGAAIEEIDIIDLDEEIALTTHADITTVYGNLRAGSCNHLRAFVRNLANQGVTYEPQYLTREEFDAIMGY